jgi:hypothetical protein
MPPAHAQTSKNFPQNFSKCPPHYELGLRWYSQSSEFSKGDEKRDVRNSVMALVARGPLADCQVAHELLKQDKKESPSWRPHWVACLALLRAVGHVLHKVDGTTDAHHREVIDAAWAEWKARQTDNAIFWNFIEAERNNLLKQYAFGVEPEPNYVVTASGERIVTKDGDEIVTKDDFFRLSLAGFEDQEGRDVIGEAIKWWHQQLAIIEAKL